MPRIFIDGQPFDARTDQTVMQVADANGITIPRLCWHPQLSVAGNCRLCVVQVEGRSWVEISCNMPVSEGLKVLTDTELVRAHRKATMQFLTLNHPVDCGICDKAGECTLQDYHVAYNGEPSISSEPKVVSTKFFPLSERITLDNERCILCTRCVRFTHEISRSHALGVQQRGDHSVIRPAGGAARPLDDDPYSENIVDLCPVGALLSRSFLYRERVWSLKATPSVCPGCERGCTIDIWHRKPEWHARTLDASHNRAIARVTPRENPAVNGAWVCNKARDLARLLERPRAMAPMVLGRAVTLAAALDAARVLIGQARRPVALVSSGGSNEELQALQRMLAASADRGVAFSCFVKPDHRPLEGEVVQDDLLIRADKNPNTRRARELFGDAPLAVPADADLVLVWGEGADLATLPTAARLIVLDSHVAPHHARADVFFAVSVMTERNGHYTNFQGTVSAFEACFPKPAPGVADAEQVFAALAAPALRAAPIAEAAR
jgi:NADH-quinone oxidoreductase subunit G